MWFKHSMSIAQQLLPIYNTTVYKNKTNVALNVVNCLGHKLNDTNRPLVRLNQIQYILLSQCHHEGGYFLTLEFRDLQRYVDI